MQVLLEGLLPRCFPDLRFLCISHEGAQDLEKSIPRKLRAWNMPGDRFVVVRDNDYGDCTARKERLLLSCQQGGREDTLVRIVCQELEAWYLGDPHAMVLAFGDERLQRFGKTRRLRNPDTVHKPADFIRKLVPSFQKIDGARRMAVHLSCEGNRSGSFRIFLQGVRKLYEEAFQ